MNPPVILLGAGRSGTKFLRGLLAGSPLLRAVPYDVNHVWTADVPGVQHDEIAADSVPARAVKRIRRRLPQLAQIRTRDSARVTLVEKTVSNTLRVGFVDRVFPEARFIHVVRDGRDVVESANRVWNERTQLRYAAAKLRCFSISDAPYLMRCGLARAISRSDRPAMWGPKYRGYDRDLASLPTPIVAARQWRACVEAATDALAQLEPSRALHIRYEDLVSNTEVVARIAGFLELDPDPIVECYTRTVRRDCGGRFASSFTEGVQQAVLDEIQPTLHRLGYLSAASAA